MIQVSPTSRIFLALTPADFRCQIDGLAAVCRQVFEEDPESGCIFVFKNRANKGIKILAFDGVGYWLCHRRLATGRIKWWPKGEGHGVTIDPQELMVLLWNGDPRGVFAEPWKRLQIEDSSEVQGRNSQRSERSPPRGSGSIDHSD